MATELMSIVVIIVLVENHDHSFVVAVTQTRNIISRLSSYLLVCACVTLLLCVMFSNWISSWEDRAIHKKNKVSGITLQISNSLIFY